MKTNLDFDTELYALVKKYFEARTAPLDMIEPMILHVSTIAALAVADKDTFDRADLVHELVTFFNSTLNMAIQNLERTGGTAQ